MNLELLDPFGRQVPDRVDSTLQLPKAFSRSSNNSTSSTTTGDNNNNNNEQRDGQQQHVVNNNNDNEDEEEEEAYICSFNRRGTYLAVGYSTGAVAIYNTLNRSLASIYNCSLKIKQPPKKRKYKKRGGKPPSTKTKTKTTKNNKAGKKKKKIATSGKGNNNKKQQQQSKAAAATAADDDDEDNVVAMTTTTLPQEQEEQEEELRDKNNINSENDHNNDIDIDDDETIVEDEDEYDDDHNDNHVDQQQKAGAVVQEDTTTITTALLLSATTTSSSSSNKKQQPKKKKSQQQQQPTTTTTTTTKKGGKVVPTTTTTTKAATTTTTKAADANGEKSSSSVVAAEGNSNVNAPNNNNNEDNDNDSNNNNNNPQQQQQYYYGCSNLSWSRRSRMLLTGATGDTKVQLQDTSHPAGPDDCSKGLFYMASGVTEESLRKDHDKNRRSEVRNMHSYSQTKNLSFANPSQRHNVCINETRALQVRTVKKPGDVIPPRDSNNGVDPTTSTSTNQHHHHHHPDNSSMDDNRKMKTKRCASVTFEFPAPVAGSLQVHPRRPNYGLAVLTNGALMVFWISAAVDAFKTKGDDICCTTKLYRNVSCACFDPHGDRVYACCKDGRLVGFDVSALCSVFDERSGGATTLPDCPPQFEVPIGEAVAWHVLVSRNNKFLVLNSSDGAIRLYNVADCWAKAASIDKPVHVFQDVVTKVKFASFDLSGDGEYIVGGANGGDNKYELYIWNTSTGALIDKLSGSSTKLYSVAWHPARSFIAVACGDGLVDIWGPRINWTAFAPDFQALPMNVEYVEREDEFDVDEDGRHLAAAHDAHQSSEGNENSLVDVTTIEAVPVFASDSEDEVEVFEFETRVKNLIAAREVTLKPAGANKASSKGNTGDD